MNNHCNYIIYWKYFWYHLKSSETFTLSFICTASTLFTFTLHQHFNIYISFHHIEQSYSVLQNHSCMWCFFYCANSIFNIQNPYEIKLLTRYHLGLSHLRDHKFRHCFQDTLNRLCDRGNNTETITHFFLHWSSFHTPRQTLLNNIRNNNKQILSQGDDQLIETFVQSAA